MSGIGLFEQKYKSAHSMTWNDNSEQFEGGINCGQTEEGIQLQIWPNAGHGASGKSLCSISDGKPACV